LGDRTIDEINLALTETIKKYKPPFPYLLDYYNTLSGKIIDTDTSTINLSNANHFVKDEFIKILETAVQ